MAMWVKGQSGNPKGPPRKGRSITGLLELRIDKDRFVEELLRFCAGGEGIDPALQLQAMRLVLSYCDGLPITRSEQQGGEKIEISVIYAQSNRPLYPAAATEGPRPAKTFECLSEPDGRGGASDPGREN